MTDLAPIALWRPPGELRRKLIEMRDDMLDRMQRRGTVEPGHLPLIAGVNAALAALDREAQTIAATPAVVDDSGEVLRLVFRTGEKSTAVPLSPVAAIALAGELLGAAGLRLGGDLAELRAKDSR